LIPSSASITLSSKSGIGGDRWLVLAGRRQRRHDQGHAAILDRIGYAEMIDRRDRPCWRAQAAVLGCLLLTVCTTETTTATRWVKIGADDQTISRELTDCNAQANAALANEQGINADINATLGRSWQLGGTQGVETQALREQATGYADQVLNNCMRAKGFTKEG
jgi:hypothetical protein